MKEEIIKDRSVLKQKTISWRWVSRVAKIAKNNIIWWAGGFDETCFKNELTEELRKIGIAVKEKK